MAIITEQDFYGYDSDGDPWYVTPTGKAICAADARNANRTLSMSRDERMLSTIDEAAVQFRITKGPR